MWMQDEVVAAQAMVMRWSSSSRRPLRPPHRKKSLAEALQERDGLEAVEFLPKRQYQVCRHLRLTISMEIEVTVSESVHTENWPDVWEGGLALDKCQRQQSTFLFSEYFRAERHKAHSRIPNPGPTQQLSLLKQHLPPSSSSSKHNLIT